MSQGKFVMNNAKVSVIIPAFNAQRWIAETLDSICGQTYSNLEIIIVDDGSTDATADIIRGYGDQVRYVYQTNSGGCAVPRNTGIGMCSGDFLCFMDADDLMTPDRIALQVAFLEKCTQVGLVFCDYKNFTEKGPFSVTHFQTCPRLWPQLQNREELIITDGCAHLLKENFGIAGSICMRRSLLDVESGFVPSLRACEDFHFYFRLARHSPVGIVNKVGLLRRFHEQNMSGDAFKMLSEGVRSRTMLLDTEQDPALLKALNSSIADYLGGLAYYHADRGQHRHAFGRNLQGLARDFCWSRFKETGRNIIRTLLIALRLHVSKADGSDEPVAR